MDFHKNILLKDFTTFRVGGPADLFCRAATVEELREAVAWAGKENLSLLILGGGSNMVVSDSGFNGLIIKLENKGVSIEKNGADILMRCAAGEPWDSIVAQAVDSGFWGIENLSHIPGNVGAFAVQNVGAYGQEASQVIESLTAFNLRDGTVKRFTPAECGFSYRKSVFNSEEKGKYAILEIVLKLSSSGRPNLSYPDAAKYFEQRGIAAPTLPEIRTAITEIRDRKFTTPDKIPNAGSFFKNSILTEGQYQALEQKVKQNFDTPVYEKLRGYKERLSTPQGIKIPSAFLIEACGLKGFTIGGVKVNETQPLVLMNYNKTATAKDILAVMKHIRQVIYDKSGLELNIEPELIGFTEAEIAEAFALDR